MKNESKASEPRRDRLGRFTIASLAALTLAVAVSMLPSEDMSASAATPTQTVFGTGVGIYPRTEPSMDSSHAGAAVPDGTEVIVYCEVVGADVHGNNVWASTSIGWLPNYWLLSGHDGRTPSVSDCNDEIGSSSGATDVGVYGIEWTAAEVDGSSSYDRSTAARWALNNFSTWDGGYDEGDCTYFVSTMLTKAGWGTTSDWTPSTSWGYNAASRWNPWGPTKDFVSADHFKNWIVDSGYATIQEIDASGNSGWAVPEAKVGDIIQYDQGVLNEDHEVVAGPDGVIDHTMVVVDIRDGVPYVVGVDSAPKQPNKWQYASNTTDTVYDRSPYGARAYLLHITR